MAGRVRCGVKPLDGPPLPTIGVFPVIPRLKQTNTHFNTIYFPYSILHWFDNWKKERGRERTHWDFYLKILSFHYFCCPKVFFGVHNWKNSRNCNYFDWCYFFQQWWKKFKKKIKKYNKKLPKNAYFSSLGIFFCDSDVTWKFLLILIWPRGTIIM